MPDLVGPFYKFLDRQWVTTLLSGQLLFRNVDYFRLLEVVTADRWIGDQGEATSTTIIENMQYRGGERRSDDQKIMETIGGIYIGENVGNVSFGKVEVINHFNGYVFCFSQGDIGGLVEAMCAPERTKYAYAGCVEIADARHLAQIILEHGTILGVPVAEKFSVLCGAVSYLDSDTKLSKEKLAGGDPFRKAREFQAQKEVRIVLAPKRGVHLENAANVHITNAKSVLREKLINVIAPIRNAESAMTAEEAWAILISIYKALRDEDSPHTLDFYSMTREQRDALRVIEDEREKSLQIKWASKAHEIAKAYWVLRDEFPDGLMDSCLRGTQPFDWGLSDYLTQHGKSPPPT
jgi:hypothetical protein